MANSGVSGSPYVTGVTLVPLKRVLFPASTQLWCDTEARKEAEDYSKAVGWPVLPSFTAPKLMWLKKHHPSDFER